MGRRAPVIPVAAERATLRRNVLAHWIVLPGVYLLLRLGHTADPLSVNVLLLGALLGVLWLTLLAYTRWVSSAIVGGILVILDLAVSTVVVALTGGLGSDFYALYGLVILLTASQLTRVWVLGITLSLTALSVGFLVWPGAGEQTFAAHSWLRIEALLMAGLVAWFYTRRRAPSAANATTGGENQRLIQFQQISERVNAQADSTTLCEFAVTMARRLTEAEVGNVLVLDSEDQTTGQLFTSIGHETLRQSIVHPDWNGEGLCDRLIRDGQPLDAFGKTLDVGTPSLLSYYPPIYSFVGVPFRNNQKVFGALFVANRRGGQKFTPEDQLAIAFLSTQVGMALDNRRLLREVRERFTSTIAALVTAIEAKHPYTRGHSERVVRYAVATARQLRLREEEIESIRVAAVLHDIGKIGVPEGILDKPGALTERERAFIMNHPYIGAKIVEALDPRGEILYVIYHHHENYDGSGYPKGLKGDQIPLGASILRVADAFEAMTSERPYQRTRTAVEALRELYAGAGRQFDPVAVRAIALALRQLAEEEAKRGSASDQPASVVTTTPGR